VAIRRGKKEIWEGTVVSLRRVKDDVDAVEAPLECGLQTDFKDWKEGDAIVAFKVSPREKFCFLGIVHTLALARGGVVQ